MYKEVILIFAFETPGRNKSLVYSHFRRDIKPLHPYVRIVFFSAMRASTITVPSCDARFSAFFSLADSCKNNRRTFTHRRIAKWTLYSCERRANRWTISLRRRANCVTGCLSWCVQRCQLYNRFTYEFTSTGRRKLGFIAKKKDGITDVDVLLGLFRRVLVKEKAVLKYIQK